MPHIGRVSVLPRLFLRNRRSPTPAASPPTHLTWFLTCRRGTVALESAIAVIPLIICLVGVFEIVQSVFVRDLTQRAAYRVAYANALRAGAAADIPELRTQLREWVQAEVGDLPSFELAGQGVCRKTPDQDDPPVDFCLDVKVYNSPTDMLNGTPSQGGNAGLGGNACDMVVVKVVAQRLFGTPDVDALTVAVRRNEPSDVSCPT